MPDEAEVHGLVALMLLHESRRAARFRDGEIVLLAEQDRVALGRRADRGRADDARSRAGAARPRAVRGAGGDRVAARGGAARLAADRRALRRAVQLTDSPVVRAQPGGRDRRGGRAGGGLAIVDAAGTRRLPLPALSARRDAAPARARRRGAGRVRRALELVHDDAERRLFERRLAELADLTRTASARARPRP